jgi:hypothetical protein
MTGSVFVMFGRLLVMLRTFMFGHFSSALLFQNIQVTYRLFVLGNVLGNVKSPLINWVFLQEIARGIRCPGAAIEGAGQRAAARRFLEQLFVLKRDRWQLSHHGTGSKRLVL